MCYFKKTFSIGIVLCSIFFLLIFVIPYFFISFCNIFASFNVDDNKVNSALLYLSITVLKERSRKGVNKEEKQCLLMDLWG